MDLTSLEGMAVLPPSFPLPLDQPFTHTTALAAGLTKRNLTWLTVHGFIRRPVKGVYVASVLPDSIPLRCACLRLVVPADAVVCDRHAGWLHGAEMVLAPNEHLAAAPITIFLPRGRGRLRNGLADSGERTLLDRDIVELGGLRVTTPLRTAWDLGRHRWPDRSLAALDQMLRLEVFSHEELVEGVQRFKGMRWMTRLKAMAPLADGRAESPPESVLRLRWIEAQLPEPTPQFEVWFDGDFLARLDLANPELRFAAEYDGAEWHSSPEQQRHDRDRRAVVSKEADWVIQPFVRENVFGYQQNAEQLLRSGAATARRRVGGHLS